MVGAILQALALASLASGLISIGHASHGRAGSAGTRHLLAAGQSLPVASAPGPANASQAASTQFSYAMGGQDWPGECGNGLTQSPINIVPATGNYSRLAQQMLPVLDFGTGKNVIVINTGHGIQVQWEADKAPNASVSLGALVGLSNTTGAIDVQFGSGRVKGLGTDRVPVTPLQFHYHSPSEHTINGKLSATEAHLVTQIAPDAVPACAPKGCLAAFGVLYDFAPSEGVRSEFLAPLLQRLPESRGDLNATRMPADYRLNFTDFFPAELGMATYSGSLTTPPCTGNVLWTVFLSTKPISNRQALALHDVMGLMEGEVHCSVVSEASVLRITAGGANADAAASGAASSAPAPGAAAGAKSGAYAPGGQPSRFSVCDGQRQNNRNLQPRNGRTVGIYTPGSPLTN